MDLSESDRAKSFSRKIHPASDLQYVPIDIYMCEWDHTPTECTIVDDLDIGTRVSLRKKG